MFCIPFNISWYPILVIILLVNNIHETFISLQWALQSLFLHLITHFLSEEYLQYLQHCFELIFTWYYYCTTDSWVKTCYLVGNFEEINLRIYVQAIRDMQTHYVFLIFRSDIILVKSCMSIMNLVYHIHSLFSAARITKKNECAEKTSF